LVDLDIYQRDETPTLKFEEHLNVIVKAFKANQPEILTGLGIVGVASTTYLTAVASFRSAAILQAAYDEKDPPEERTQRVKEQLKLVWPQFVPPLLSAGATMGFIFSAHRVNTRRTAAAVAAYSLSEKAFSEYKEKIKEEIGEKKLEKLKDEIVEEKVRESYSPEKEIERVREHTNVISSGDVLCCDLTSMRYFRSDMETLKSAQNKVNARLLNEGYMSIAEFYYEIGVYPAEHTRMLGWESDKLMELEFTSSLTDDNQPCLVFIFNYVKPLFN
jgi:hypothetical protein